MKNLFRTILVTIILTALIGGGGTALSEDRMGPQVTENSMIPYLSSNEMVLYTEDSPWINAASELSQGARSKEEIYERILQYYSKSFVYDFVKYVVVEPDAKPDPEDCWNRRAGVDLDLGSLVCSMLRSQGIPSILFVQKDGSEFYPVWVLAICDGEMKICNPARILVNADDSATAFFLAVASPHEIY